MLESIGDIFSTKKSRAYSGSDIKPIVEAWLQRQLQSDRVYCDDVSGGSVSVRVGDPVLYQETMLRWHDLQNTLQEEYSYSVDTVVVTPSYF